MKIKKNKMKPKKQVKRISSLKISTISDDRVKNLMIKFVKYIKPFSSNKVQKHLVLLYF